jgi:hypothetical protein
LPEKAQKIEGKNYDDSRIYFSIFTVSPDALPPGSTPFPAT